METERLRVLPHAPDTVACDAADAAALTEANAAAIARAAALLRADGLVAFPTETVYGLGANALSAAAVARIFAAKERPEHDPLIVHVADEAALAGLVVNIPPVAHLLMQHFWPGPLTLILERTAAVPDAVTAGLPGVAVRAPNHAVALALLVACGLPIAAPSANRFGHTSPTTADHVLADLDGRIEMVLDGGPTPIGVESTVLDMTRVAQGEPALLLRPGGVPLEALRELLGENGVAVVTSSAPRSNEAQRSPGLLERHYAPHTPLLLFEPASDAADATGAADASRAPLECLMARAAVAQQAGARPILLAYDEDRATLEGLRAGGCLLVALGPLSDPAQVARRLYGALREADAQHGTLLLARTLPGAGLAAAVRDRLRRAADEIVLCPAAAQEAGG